MTYLYKYKIKKGLGCLAYASTNVFSHPLMYLNMQCN